LSQRIQQFRSIGGDPWTKTNAIFRASGLTPTESQTLLQAVQPLAGVTPVNDAELMGMRNPNQAQAIVSRNSDAITNVIRTHKFDDPGIEKLRQRVATQWDTMDSLVGTVFDSVNQ
jgi:hypothetical protein